MYTMIKQKKFFLFCSIHEPLPHNPSDLTWVKVNVS